MWYPHHDFSWEMILFGGLMMLLFWGGLIALVVWLFRSQGRSGASRSAQRWEDESSPGPSRDALEILKERYARGEISREEFLNMRDDLTR